jgi:ubiquinone/menaquinone biosynthesis C-methylase UbiE
MLAWWRSDQRSAAAAATATGFECVGGQECDVQQLPFDDESFDIVVANHMLYHVPAPDRAIAELARVVRADGGSAGRDQRLWPHG